MTTENLKKEINVFFRNQMLRVNYLHAVPGVAAPAPCRVIARPCEENVPGVDLDAVAVALFKVVLVGRRDEDDGVNALMEVKHDLNAT